MPLRLRGGRGRGNRGRVARLDDIGQPHKSLFDHLEREDDRSVSGGEYVDSTSASISRAYPTAPQPQPVPIPLVPPLVPPIPQLKLPKPQFQADASIGALMM